MGGVFCIWITSTLKLEHGVGGMWDVFYCMLPANVAGPCSCSFINLDSGCSILEVVLALRNHKAIRSVSV